jgi:putative transposase
MARPPRIPVWLPEDQPIIYFITLCVEERKQVLNSPHVFEIIKNFCTNIARWEALAMVVMPDHLHALIAPRDREAKITQFSAGLKRLVKKQLKSDWEWQSGVFDRLLRTDEKAEEKWLYIRENPVRAGLVKQWSDWPYSIGFKELKPAAKIAALQIQI